MPLYEYKCEKCGKRFDALQKFSDDPLKVHEECGGVLERLVSPPAFHFKGTGWYVTDYAKSNGVSTPSESGGSKDEGSKKEDGAKKDEGAKKENGSKKTESKSEGQSESKKEAKTESTPAPASSSSEK